MSLMRTLYITSLQGKSTNNPDVKKTIEELQNIKETDWKRVEKYVNGYNQKVGNIGPQ